MFQAAVANFFFNKKSITSSETRNGLGEIFDNCIFNDSLKTIVNGIDNCLLIQ